MNPKNIKNDCRKFVGEKPCKPGLECPNCSDYHRMGTRILIIKCAAGGDVLRTVSLLQGLKKTYNPCHITWVTLKANMPLLMSNPDIDILYQFDGITSLIVTSQVYDLVINLEKTPDCTALTERVIASRKRGFGMDRFGNLRPLTKDAEYAFELGLSDDLKFTKNKMSYPEIIYEICRIPYEGEDYRLFLSAKQKKLSKDFGVRFSAKDSFLIGLNTGSGPVFATKKWPRDKWLGLIERLSEVNSGDLVLLGGPDEVARNQHILNHCSGKVQDSGNNNSLEEFCALVAAMDIVVTADTLAMHIALALQKKVVVLSGPTSINEIDLFGRGAKLYAELDCMPCYKKECERSPTCMDAIEVTRVREAIEQFKPVI